ncbi:hypothetical protein DB88DRAFT_475290 [Papiliotrema laurentii]|uniref:Uncharacterized protein n=1 Tax=Papiliotrema laurentii TaxID=5418 RepID=A0AAD9FQ15_PAPLA|nr:hypothetical protein DB88DRAFT_475290 [Papiliotrema laurentii]
MPSEQQYQGDVFPPPASVAEDLVEQLSYVIGEVVENERKRLERLSEPDPVPDDDTLLNNIMYNQKSFESLCQSMSDDLEQIVQEVGASAVASRDKETVDRVNNTLEGVASEFVNKFSDPSPQPPVRTAFLKTFPHAIRALTSKLMEVMDPRKLDKEYSDQGRGLIVQMTPSIDRGHQGLDVRSVSGSYSYPHTSGWEHHKDGGDCSHCHANVSETGTPMGIGRLPGCPLNSTSTFTSSGYASTAEGLGEEIS